MTNNVHRQSLECNFCTDRMPTTYAELDTLTLAIRREHFSCASHLLCLKAVDTIGNCQRQAFTVGVPQHMHKITNL